MEGVEQNEKYHLSKWQNEKMGSGMSWPKLEID